MRCRIYGILVQMAVRVTPLPGATWYAKEELENRMFGGSVFVADVVVFGDTLIGAHNRHRNGSHLLPRGRTMIVHLYRNVD
jgi:hypothetical protein